METIDITQLNVPNTISFYRLPEDTYFVDPVTCDVYSRRRGRLIPLLGSCKGLHRWYTFRPVRAGGTPVYVRKDHLDQAIANYWMGTGPVSQPAPPDQSEVRGQWIIGTRTADGQYSFAVRPRIHETEASVNAEAERLARNNPGQTYVKVRLEGQVVAGGINWS